MPSRPKPNRWTNLAAALGAVALVGLSPAPARAQSEILDELLDKLKEKGVLSDDEYQALKKAREEERLEERDSRRRQALKEAQDTEQQAKAKEAEAKATKFDVNPGIRSIQLFGDVRLRFEAREGTSTSKFPAAAGGAANLTDESRERWRYAVRVGIRGDLTDDWFYGLRFETADNPRSPWVTFGDESSASGSGVGPSGKGSDKINVGQVYLGWRTTPWLTLQAGKMPNPFYTTPMVWDPDIQPEALAEKLTYKIGDSVELFGNLAQILYTDINPDLTNGSDLGFHKKDAFMLGWQAGGIYKFGPATNLKAAVTYYQYVGLGCTQTKPTTAANPNGFCGPFIGQNNATNAGLLSQNGINNLQVLEIPWEFNFPALGLSARVFGDFAKNLDADARAKAAGFQQFGDNDKAYQIGLGYGTLGEVYGQTSKKGTWEVRTYWQRIEQYALDPNLTDSDFFEGRTNVQGLYLAGAYSWTDSILTTIRYGFAHRVNGNLGTGGSNPDLPTINPLTDYRLLQFDLTWRF
jgi:hypothetical protein